MAWALLLVDVIKDFEHEEGERLLESFRRRHAGLTRALAEARGADTPVVYANDNAAMWDSNAPALLSRALAGKAGELIAEVAPQKGDHIVLKPRYSAFDETPLAFILRELSWQNAVRAACSRRASTFLI